MSSSKHSLNHLDARLARIESKLHNFSNLERVYRIQARMNQINEKLNFSETFGRLQYLSTATSLPTPKSDLTIQSQFISSHERQINSIIEGFGRVKVLMGVLDRERRWSDANGSRTNEGDIGESVDTERQSSNKRVTLNTLQSSLKQLRELDLDSLTQESDQFSNEVMDVLERYNNMTRIVSQKFLMWEEMLREVEREME